MTSTRRFGVEIECGHPQGEDHVRKELKKLLSKSPLSVGYDGTGVEVRSPILKGNDGFKWLHEAMETMRGLGCYITTSDGMHVHHEAAPGFMDKTTRKVSAVDCARLVKTWNNLDSFIEKCVAPRRRGGRYVCAKVWNQHTIKNLEDKGQHRVGERMAALNLWHLSGSKGTIEVRLHEGTLDPDEAEAWIRLCQGILDSVLKRKTPIEKEDKHEAILDRFLDDDKHKEVLLEKIKRNGKPAPNSAFRSNRVHDVEQLPWYLAPGSEGAR